MGWKKKIAFGTVLAAGTTLTIHVINKMLHISATADNLTSNPSGLCYNWKFGNIFYTKQGEGTPILLIHDLSTYSSSNEWDSIVSDLSKTNTVYAIDLLGCGHSDKPNITYTSYLYVQLISDFIKQVIKEKTDVIATGESGSFVLAACQNDKSIIDKVIMVNPYDIKLLSKSPGKRSKLLTKLINLPVFGTFFYNMCTKKTEVYRLFEDEYFYNSTKINNELVLTYYENAHLGNPDSKYLFASLAGCYTTINIKHCLKELDNSIFIIIGKEKEEYKEIAEEYADIIPSVEIVEVEKTKYLPQLELPEEFTEQVNVLFSTL